MEQTQSLHIIDYIIIIVSFIVSLAVGLKFARRQKTTKHYFIAGGKMPSWAIEYLFWPLCQQHNFSGIPR